MGASIKLSATGTVLRKSGTLVVTKLPSRGWLRQLPRALFRNMVLKLDSLPDFNAGAGGGDGYDQWRTLRFHHAAVRHKRRSWGICVDVVGVRAAHDDDYSGHCRELPRLNRMFSSAQYYRSWWALPWGTLTLNYENFSAKRCKR